MYAAGELDKVITIQREVKTPDGMGGNTVTLTDVVADLRAHVRPKTGGERAAYDSVEASAMYLFVVRYRSDILESDRILWDGKYYNIRAIMDRGSRANYLEIDAQRGVTQ